ncbi:MAG: sulfotransferase domain-containing protein [Wenzhouxiangella sp.]|jgi:hypothetical protein|nr:sulfotransferase domain-containing protein [Wenzhouxiangella sp.]
MKTFWLVSYPKSGNTWFRVFLSNLLHPERSPVDPNNLPIKNLIASARSPFHEIVGVPPSLLIPAEYDDLRPAVDRVIGRDWPSAPCLRKAHDAYTYLPDGRPLMGESPDFAAIYILRNPWDVAVSASNHWATTVEKTVDIMCRDDSVLDGRKDRITTQLRQRLLSWSGHAESWLNAPLDLCFLRYEDMHFKPLETFRRAAQFLELQASDEQIETAIAASRFERLQRIERERGFREAPASRAFFRSGKVGAGRDLLSASDRRRLAQENDIVDQVLRRRFGGAE